MAPMLIKTVVGQDITIMEVDMVFTIHLPKALKLLMARNILHITIITKVMIITSV